MNMKIHLLKWRFRSWKQRLLNKWPLTTKRLDFAPEMMGMTGYSSKDEMRILAGEIAHRVEADIATSRFITEAERT